MRGIIPFVKLAEKYFVFLAFLVYSRIYISISFRFVACDTICRLSLCLDEAINDNILLCLRVHAIFQLFNPICSFCFLEVVDVIAQVLDILFFGHYVVLYGTIELFFGWSYYRLILILLLFIILLIFLCLMHFYLLHLLEGQSSDKRIISLLTISSILTILLAMIAVPQYLMNELALFALIIKPGPVERLKIAFGMMIVHPPNLDLLLLQRLIINVIL